MTTSVAVDPAVHPPSVKAKSPCGKRIPCGALPAGGLDGLFSSGMNCAVVKLHAGPPDTDTLIVPVPVALAPLKVVMGPGGSGQATPAVAAGPGPTAFVAMTVQK